MEILPWALSCFMLVLLGWCIYQIGYMNGVKSEIRSKYLSDEDVDARREAPRKFKF